MSAPYAPYEDKLIRDMAATGLTNGQIARRLTDQLGRSRQALRWRCRTLLPGKNKPKRRSVEVQTRTITKAELPEYYAQGWRVVWHEGDAVGIEWRKG